MCFPTQLVLSRKFAILLIFYIHTIKSDTKKVLYTSTTNVKVTEHRHVFEKEKPIDKMGQSIESKRDKQKVQKKKKNLRKWEKIKLLRKRRRRKYLYKIKKINTIKSKRKHFNGNKNKKRHRKKQKPNNTHNIVNKKKVQKENIQRSESVDNDKMNAFLEKILGIEEKARKKTSVKEIIKKDTTAEDSRVLKADYHNSILEKVENKKNIEELKKIEIKKVTNKKVKKVKCQWWKKKYKNSENKLKKYMDNNCARAKQRSKMSFETMWLIFQQCYEQSKVLKYVKAKQKRYTELISSMKDFIEKNKICQSNRYWNPKMIEEKMNDFNRICMTNLGECLVQEETNSSVIARDNGFDPDNLPFTEKEKNQAKECLEAQKKADKCSHCRRKCGSAMKKGELCVKQSVELLSILQTGREQCLSLIRQCDKTMSNFIHDLYSCWGAYCDYCDTCHNCLTMCKTATHICWCKDEKKYLEEEDDYEYYENYDDSVSEKVTRTMEETVSTQEVQITKSKSTKKADEGITTKTITSLNTLKIEPIRTDSRDETISTFSNESSIQKSTTNSSTKTMEGTGSTQQLQISNPESSQGGKVSSMSSKSKSTKKEDEGITTKSITSVNTLKIEPIKTDSKDETTFTFSNESSTEKSTTNSSTITIGAKTLSKSTSLNAMSPSKLMTTITSTIMYLQTFQTSPIKVQPTNILLISTTPRYSSTMFNKWGPEQDSTTASILVGTTNAYKIQSTKKMYYPTTIQMVLETTISSEGINQSPSTEEVHVSTTKQVLQTRRPHSEPLTSTAASQPYLYFTTKSLQNVKKVQGKRIELNRLLKAVRKKSTKL
eukprot:GFUD01000197.1.p1 GENE.GFUD01000197.1~~GFUD01000197.1.p1  ORF type:complete len:830 (+),score=199.74 GFUD01000197.1:118-2607(+)